MKRIVSAALLMTCLLTGCGMSGLLPQGSTHAASQNELYAAQTAKETHELRPQLMETQTVCLWAREQLPEELQATYDLLDHTAAVHGEEPVQVEATQEEVRRCLSALRIDHPEYFWFDGAASYTTASVPILGDSTSVTLTYTMDAEMARSLKPQVDAYEKACFDTLAAAQTDYQKILGVYQYIIANTDYVLDVQDQSMICVMTEHRGTCAGYAKTFQYLMLRLGIPCTLALGTGEGSESHGWNIVECGGDWYQVDVTWGDPVDETGAPGTSLDYTYFMLTDDEMYRDHSLDADMVVPVCRAVEYNYYRQSGRQLAAWDAVAYEGLLRSASAQGDAWLPVRFDRREDYDAAIRALIDQGGIMTVLSNCGITVPEDGISYARNDLFLELTVQLPK